MATKIVKVRICDICGKTPAHTWRIGLDGVFRDTELCTTHGKVISGVYRAARARRTIKPDEVVAPRKGPRTLRV